MSRVVRGVGSTYAFHMTFGRVIDLRGLPRVYGVWWCTRRNDRVLRAVFWQPRLLRCSSADEAMWVL